MLGVDLAVEPYRASPPALVGPGSARCRGHGPADPGARRRRASTRGSRGSPCWPRRRTERGLRPALVPGLPADVGDAPARRARGQPVSTLDLVAEHGGPRTARPVASCCWVPAPSSAGRAGAGDADIARAVLRRWRCAVAAGIAAVEVVSHRGPRRAARARPAHAARMLARGPEEGLTAVLTNAVRYADRWTVRHRRRPRRLPPAGRTRHCATSTGPTPRATSGAGKEMAEVAGEVAAAAGSPASAAAALLAATGRVGRPVPRSTRAPTSASGRCTSPSRQVLGLQDGTRPPDVGPARRCEAGHRPALPAARLRRRREVGSGSTDELEHDPRPRLPHLLPHRGRCLST